ncbi:hypothetical protein NW768_008098 [Fusarium equiseti]|uniref:F-box domain-containing protein n=1 Tax=Fusarium equiseti TaxID=61235 RepID=A0ABQ8R661_FUSEQ|nr:hypothetical protein NW768_008098 [Fusarium equiseti]
MTSPALQYLPPEILLLISDELPHRDRKSLSAVNGRFRNQLVRRLFRHIQIDCPLSQDSNLQHVIDKYGDYVTGLLLNVTFLPNPPSSSFEGTELDLETDWYEEEKWYWYDYPDSVWAQDASDVPIMHDLIQFKGMPKCTSLGIRTDGEGEFEPHGGWDDDGFYGYDFCASVESWEEVKEKERKYSWRQAWNELWRDVAKFSKMERLDLFNYLPIKASWWLEPEWAAFVGRLKDLKIRAFGQDNGFNTQEGFCSFFNDMPEFLFRHATNLEHLYIAGHEDAHLSDGTLRFKEDTMTQLKSLHFENMSISTSLMDFLSGSTPKLESLHLDNVAAWGTVFTPVWADFWEAVREGNPALKEVIYRYPRTPPLSEEERLHGHDPTFDATKTDDEQEAQARKMVADDDTLTIWPYICADDTFGELFEMEDPNLYFLVLGHDNTEYKLLMKEIKERQQETTAPSDN